MITEERSKQLAAAIDSYCDKEKLFDMTPENAAHALNVNENDFTADELKEYKNRICSEIDADALSEVAGGFSISGRGSGGGGGCSWGDSSSRSRFIW